MSNRCPRARCHHRGYELLTYGEGPFKLGRPWGRDGAVVPEDGAGRGTASVDGPRTADDRASGRVRP
jgi:hypothetical protein